MRPIPRSANAFCRIGAEQLKHFKKVMPRDFKRVLEAIAEAERTGEDVDTAIMAAANA